MICWPRTARIGHPPVWLLGWILVVLAPSVARAQSDNPRLRWEHFYRQRAYPSATIAPRALQDARDDLIARWPNPLTAAPAMSAGPWQQIGPERIPISLTSTGRLSAIAVHPTDANTIYIGGAQGGVWKTTDGGTSWTPQTDSECSLAMGSIAIDPVDPNIVYAGTGEQHFSADSYYGCGVLRTADGGASWVHVGAAQFQTAAGGARISRVVIDPATAGSVSSTTVLVASDFGVFRSTNSGANWTEVLSGIATDLVVDPSDNTVLYAAVDGNGVSKSTDGGVSWTVSSSGLPSASVGRINLAIAPSDPQTLFASIQHASQNDLLGIFKTTTGAATWVQATASGAGCGVQCWYDMALAVHPTDPNTVYFGGISLFRSTDGGSNFFGISGGIHVDQHYLAFDPQNPNTVYVGNDGGIYKSTDAGSSWSSLNTNLSLTQFYGGASLHPTDPNDAIGGTQDNGTVGFTGTPDWSSLFGGDGGFTAIDFLNPTTRYTETQWTQSSGFSGPRRSDGGNAGPFSLKVSGIITSERGLFIPPLVMSPSDPQTLYFGTVRLYQTTNRADLWQAISPDLTSGGSISSIAEAPSDPSVIYVGTSSGDVQVTTNGGTVWTAINAGLPNRFVTDIAVDPTDSQTAYLTVSGFGSGHVFVTADAGMTWQDVSANLPNVPVNAILLEPGTPSTIYLGSDLGAFVSTDGGGSWSPFNDGLPLVAVFDLAVNDNTDLLLAATHGRGMFSRTLDIVLSMFVTPATRLDTAVVGTTTLVPDSARVGLVGLGSSTLNWTATHGGGTWLTLTTASGTGDGTVRWDRDPTGLPPGTHVDTITVVAAGASGSPATIIDSLIVEQLLALTLGPTSRVDTMVAGATVPVTDSTTLTLFGAGSGSASWTASHGAATWLSLSNQNGVASSSITWTRSAAQLAAGTFVDTITVTAPGAIGSPAVVIDSLVVAAPIALDAAAEELFFGGVLSALHVAFLDSQGNDDGVFNLGDVLAWIDWCEGPAPGGCVSAAASLEPVRQRLDHTPSNRTPGARLEVPR